MPSLGIGYLIILVDSLIPALACFWISKISNPELASMKAMFASSLYGIAYVCLRLSGQIDGDFIFKSIGLAFGCFAVFLMGKCSVFRYQPWVTTFFCIGLGLATAFLSGPQGGAGKIMHFLIDVLHLPESQALTINFFFRKSVHVTVYGLLALGPFINLQYMNVKFTRSFACGFVWALPHAILDEFNQSTTNTRSGTFGDVFLDFCGMILFMFCTYYIFSRRKLESPIV